MASQTHIPRLAELGHVGIRCFNVEDQLKFYSDVLGLAMTDYDAGKCIYFLSSRPELEHHELLLTSGRDVASSGGLIQQVSFRCGSFEDLLGFYRRFREWGTRLDSVVSHGNALGVYFYDPEGNRGEVYWQTGLEVRQPFTEPIDIEIDAEVLMDRIRDSVEEHERSNTSKERRNE